MNLPSLARRVERLKWSHAAIFLVVVFLAANWQLLAGKAYERWDAYDLGAPALALLADSIRAGHILYWNPWIAGGSPDFAIAGSGVFSPDLLLFGALTGLRGNAYLAYWLLVWISGGLGMLLLARHLRAPAWGGLVVSLGFVFSGFYTGHGQHTGVLYSYSLLPFIIWRFDVALMQRRTFAAAQAGVLWGLSALAGYPALTICTVGLLIAWGVGRYWFALNEERAQNWRSGLVRLIVVGAVGCVVLAPSYFSVAYEGRGYSERSEPLGREFALSSNALHPGALATLASPALIELKLWQLSLWSYTDASSANLYTGGVILLLALLAVTGGPQRKWHWFLLGLALFALACAISKALPVRGWLYDFLPPTRFFRHASMLRGFFLFLISVLALFGAKEISHAHNSVLRRLSIIAPLLAIAATVGFVAILISVRIEHPEGLLARAHLLFIWGGLTTVASICRRRTQAAPLLPLALIFFATIDGLLACHFSEGTMYSKATRPTMPLPISSSINLGTAGLDRAPGTGSNINLFFKVPAFKSYAPFKNRYQEAMVKDRALSAMALGGDRIWFAPDAPEVPPTQDAFDLFTRRIYELRAPIILRHARAAMLGTSTPTAGDALAAARNAQPAIDVPVHIIEYWPDRLAFDCTVPRDGWLMVTDRWSRSWRATVNGQPQPVSGADFIFRAVPVSKGNNRVDFSFHPLGMPGLLIISWTVVAVIGLFSLPIPFARIVGARDTEPLLDLAPRPTP